MTTFTKALAELAFAERVSYFQLFWSMFFISALVAGRITDVAYIGYMLAGMAIEMVMSINAEEGSK